MVKMRDSKGKTGEGYARIFGNAQVAVLFSKLQSAIIRSGIELETMLEAAVAPEIVTTLDALGTITHHEVEKLPIQVVFKPARPDPDGAKHAIQADILIVDNTQRLFMLVEVKDGYVFDTKKADGELASLKSITSWLAQEYPYRAHYYLCAFNQDDKAEIVRGVKNRFSLDHVLTGRELCAIIGVDYDALCEQRALDQRDNRHYFLTELLAIPEIRQEIETLLNTLDE